MDDTSYTVRVPKRWARIALIAGVTALVVAPRTAVATHSFSDVPENNTFHADIEWLADSGVTKGCNPPENTEFCPDDPVTREQMSAFMRRLAGYMGAEDGTPAQADNATQLGDEEPSAYDTFVVGDSTEGIEDVTDPTIVAETSFSTSTETSIVITGTASFDVTGPLTDVDVWAQHNDTACVENDFRIPGAFAFATAAEEGVEPLANSAAFTAAVSLPAGSHSMTLCLDPNGDPVNVHTAGLTAVVSPSTNSVVSTPPPVSPSPLSR